MIKAIGFDIDGTLYPETSLYFNMLGASIGKLRFLIAFSKVRRELRQLLNSEDFRKLNISTHNDFHNFQAELVAKRLGWDLKKTKNLIDDFFYAKSIDTFETIKLYKGVPQMLDTFKAEGFKLGALSDFPCEKKITIMGLLDKFDAYLTSEEIGLVKPDPTSFRVLSEKLGIPCNEILYVGNSERYDIDGAKAAGMKTALITNNSKKRARSKADFVFFKYPDLVNYVLENRNN